MASSVANRGLVCACLPAIGSQEVLCEVGGWGKEHEKNKNKNRENAFRHQHPEADGSCYTCTFTQRRAIYEAPGEV